MTIQHVIPEVWSARLIHELRRRFRWKDAVADVSGEVAMGGNTLHIGEITSVVTIGDYTKDTDIADPDILSDADLELNLNQQKYFNIAVDDIDRVQAKPALMTEFLSDATYKMAGVMDAFVSGVYTTNIPAGAVMQIPAAQINLTPQTITDANAKYIFDYFLGLTKVLEDKDWPMGDSGGEGGTGAGMRPFCFVPSWVVFAIKKHLVTQGIAAGQGTAESVITNGMLDGIFGFRIRTDRSLPNSKADNAVVAALGLRNCIAFAQQIRRIEPYRMEKRFSDAIKGLHVYGATRIDPDKMLAITVDA